MSKIPNIDMATANPQEIRDFRRTVLRVEQGNEKIRWAAFQEQRKREELAALRFERKEAGYDKKTPTPDIERFLHRLRKRVNKEMRKKGGTPFSILRSYFLFFDADNSGQIDAEELLKVTSKLALPVTKAEAEKIVAYYDKEGNGEFSYKDLVDEMKTASPHFLEFPESVTQSSRGISGPITEVRNKYAQYDLPSSNRPKIKSPSKIVAAYIRKMQKVLKKHMREQGGTEYSILRTLFLSYDADQSGMIDAEELRSAMKTMGITLSAVEAGEIVQFYAAEGAQEMSYKTLVSAVTAGAPHYMTHPESERIRESARRLQALNEGKTSRSQMETYRFTARPANKPRNKTVERFKNRLRAHLEQVIKRDGSTIFHCIRNAFLFWDGDASGSLDPHEFKGAINRLGMAVSDEECRQVVAHYDFSGTGEMRYERLVEEVAKGSTKVLDYLDTQRIHEIDGMLTDVRCPEGVEQICRRVAKAAVRAATKAAAGQTGGPGAPAPPTPAELLQGTFLRHDPAGRHQVSRQDMDRVFTELRAGVKPQELDRLVAWYDRDGTRGVDYRALVADCARLMGRALSTRSLPPVLAGGSGRGGATGRSVLGEKKEIERQLREIQQKEQALQRRYNPTHKRTPQQAKALAESRSSGALSRKTAVM